MDFFVRCKCKFRRFIGGTSRNLHAADGGKDIARRAAELHGGAFIKLPFVSGFFTSAAVCLLYSGENRGIIQARSEMKCASDEQQFFSTASD